MAHQNTEAGMELHEESMLTNTVVFILLLVLLILTYVAYGFDLGTIGGVELNLLLALFIATIKAAMVLMIFMHVRLSPKLVWVFSMCAFLWLVLMIAGFENDYMTRHWDSTFAHTLLSPEAATMQNAQ
jgi:cytochrome c oxidase subunit 4